MKPSYFIFQNSSALKQQTRYAKPIPYMLNQISNPQKVKINKKRSWNQTPFSNQLRIRPVLEILNIESEMGVIYMSSLASIVLGQQQHIVYTMVISDMFQWKLWRNRAFTHWIVVAPENNLNCGQTQEWVGLTMLWREMYNKSSSIYRKILYIYIYIEYTHNSIVLVRAAIMWPHIYLWVSVYYVSWDILFGFNKRRWQTYRTSNHRHIHKKRRTNQQIHSPKHLLAHTRESLLYKGQNHHNHRTIGVHQKGAIVIPAGVE